jgi:hypothetical protein
VPAGEFPVARAKFFQSLIVFLSSLSRRSLS